MTTESRIFFYAGMNPTNGIWIDGDDIENMGDVYEQLESAGIIKSGFEGDILAADAEGLALGFIGKYGSFDIEKFAEFRDAEGEDDAKLAFINWIDEAEQDVSIFKEAYIAKFDSEEEFAQHWIDETHGDAIKEAEQAGLHIDWEGTARDLFIDGFVYVDGHVFRNI